jgi:hypothetical protein
MLFQHPEILTENSGCSLGFIGAILGTQCAFANLLPEFAQHSSDPAENGDEVGRFCLRLSVVGSNKLGQFNPEIHDKAPRCAVGTRLCWRWQTRLDNARPRGQRAHATI